MPTDKIIITSLLPGGFFHLVLRRKIFRIKPIYTLNRNQRLKSRKKIQWLFEKGTARTEPPLRMVYAWCPGAFPLQAAFSVSKKKFRKAVQRNRIKRLMREAWRLHAVPLRQQLAGQQQQLAVFLLFTGHEMPDYQSIEANVKKMIGYLQKQISAEMDHSSRNRST